MPPTPCTPNTSNASSAPSMRLRPPTPHRQTRPASRPITIEPIGPTKPAAGVTATRPATAPDAAPSIEALPLCRLSPRIHDSAAAAVASTVFTKARPAAALAAPAEPALKPNQPTHSSEAPTMVSVSECGVKASLP
ncbi:hypothetical protein D3C72_1738320 [compost metagenome]